MRTASAGLIADIANECTTLVRLWRLVRADGTILTFTDGVRPILYNAETYASDISFTSSAVMTSSVLANAQGVTMLVMLDDDGISRADLFSRRYEGATAQIMVINYADTSHGVMTIFKGRVGQARFCDKLMAQVDLVPESAALAGRYLGSEMYQATCRLSLGLGGCPVNIEALKVAFTVDTASGSHFTASELSQADDYWVQGYVVWVTGDNAGLRSLVARSDQGDVSVDLVETPRKTIDVGDTGFMYPGCDKTPVTCRDRFNVMESFSGEPFVPGDDIIPQIPVQNFIGA